MLDEVIVALRGGSAVPFVPMELDHPGQTCSRPVRRRVLLGHGSATLGAPGMVVAVGVFCVYMGPALAVDVARGQKPCPLLEGSTALALFGLGEGFVVD